MAVQDSVECGRTKWRKSKHEQKSKIRALLTKLICDVSLDGGVRALRGTHCVVATAALPSRAANEKALVTREAVRRWLSFEVGIRAGWLDVVVTTAVAVEKAVAL